jgi:4-aminobutyrate aminotransferase
MLLAPYPEADAKSPSALYYPVSDKRMTHGEGVSLFDEDGNAYIDCAAGTFNLSLGYSHPAVLVLQPDFGL